MTRDPPPGAGIELLETRARVLEAYSILDGLAKTGSIILHHDDEGFLLTIREDGQEGSRQIGLDPMTEGVIADWLPANHLRRATGQNCCGRAAREG